MKIQIYQCDFCKEELTLDDFYDHTKQHETDMFIEFCDHYKKLRVQEIILQ